MSDTDKQRQATSLAAAGHSSLDEVSDSRKPDVLAHDIEHTRTSMSHTLAAIEQRLNPSDLREKAVEELHVVEVRVREVVKEQIEETKVKVREELIEAKAKLKEELLEAKEMVKGELIEAKDKVKGELIEAKDKARDEVKQAFWQAKHEVKEAFNEAGQAVRDATIGKVENMARRANESLVETRETIIETVRANPIPAALTGLGLLWLFMNRSQTAGIRVRERARQDDSRGRGGYGERGYDDRRTERGYSTEGFYGDRSAYARDNQRQGYYAGPGREYDDRGRYQGQERHDHNGMSDAWHQAQAAAGHAVDQAGEMAHQAQDRVSGLAHQAQDRVSGLAHQAQDRVSGLAHQAQDTASHLAHQAQDTVSGLAHQVSDAATGAAGKVAGTASDLANQVTDKATQFAQQATATASDLSHRASARADQISHQASDAYQHYSDEARQQVRRVEDGFQHTLQVNPLALGAVALAVGAVVGLSLPSTRREDELLGETRDHLRDEVLHRAQGAAHDALEGVHHLSEQAAENLKGSLQTGHQALDSPGSPESSDPSHPLPAPQGEGSA